ncbi:MAG: Chaperone of endosialidase [Rhodobacteraceae bacterium HLUCCA08]|nr:MAG: Chaperone of endosialidase [Rhodobacteraceae bacterium HLUCCA08]
MKNLFLAAALCAPIAVQAGGMADPVMPIEIIEAETESRSSSAGLLLPLIIVAALVAVASGGSDDGGSVAMDSDVRLKTDIVPVGMTASGLPIYQYRYTGSTPVFEGVMAQDVLAHTPEAVVSLHSGYLAVRYDMIDADLKIVE